MFSDRLAEYWSVIGHFAEYNTERNFEISCAGQGTIFCFMFGETVISQAKSDRSPGWSLRSWSVIGGRLIGWAVVGLVETMDVMVGCVWRRIVDIHDSEIMISLFFLNRLNYLHGISGTCLSWFCSYFSNRRQSVAIANRIWSTKELHYGVSQGSVLGPILFVLYIKPLSNLIKWHSLSVHLFAGDIQIKTSILPQHVHSAISSVKICISDVKYWMILILDDKQVTVEWWKKAMSSYTSK